MFDPSAIETWISVTGMIRSGTTFLGTALSLPRTVDYLHEPFNGGVSLPDRRPFEARYVRPGAAGAEVEAYRDHLAHIFRYRLSLPTTRHPRDSRWRRLVKSVVGSRGPVHLALARANPFHRAAVIKDPTSKLVTEYLHLEFGVRPVIVVRHPVSLAASLQRVGWWPEMRDFTDQPDLVADYFADEAPFLERRWPSPLLEAMAHWRATHKVLLAQARAHPDWIVLTHEALSREPVPVLRRLYADLGLPWSAAVERKIRAMTGGRNTAEASGNQAMDLNRDAASIFEMRRDAVAPADRRAIFEVVKDVALELYSEDSFALTAPPTPAPHSP